MTIDEFMEKALREKNIFPPSVQDSHYGDNAEMTRGEIIEKTLREMNVLALSEQDAQSSDETGQLSTMITRLQRRLPHGNIKTCSAIKPLNAPCCDTCHTFYHGHEMKLIVLPDGGKAWVCCFVENAIYPKSEAELSPEQKFLREISGSVDSPKE